MRDGEAQRDLERGVELRPALGLRAQRTAELRALVEASEGGGPFDYVIGSDLTYDPDTYPVLLETLGRLATRGSNPTPPFSGSSPNTARESFSWFALSRLS